MLVSVVSWSFFVLGWSLELLIVFTLIAQKSLYDHVRAVFVSFHKKDLITAKKALSQIVGRDISNFDESSVSRAAIESLAENFSDGVLAPVFWYSVLGLPGILFYKAINTTDSMIGYHSIKYEYFGKAAAKIDDFLNWPASRLSAGLVIVAGLSQGKLDAIGDSYKNMRDASLHPSPNSGWPEMAFASVLGIMLGGERCYTEGRIQDFLINAEGREILTATDIMSALSLYKRTCHILLILVISFVVF